jgi:hypothetical protein
MRADDTSKLEGIMKMSLNDGIDEPKGEYHNYGITYFLAEAPNRLWHSVLAFRYPAKD